MDHLSEDAREIHKGILNGWAISTISRRLKQSLCELCEVYGLPSLRTNMDRAEQLTRVVSSSIISPLCALHFVLSQVRRNSSIAGTLQVCEPTSNTTIIHKDEITQAIPAQLVSQVAETSPIPLQNPMAHGTTNSQTHVIGKGVLKEIHKDMELVQLPNWLQPAPKSFGTSAHGKLSADQ